MLARVTSGAYDNNSVYTIEKSGRYCLQWSVDGLDYIDTTEEEIFNRVVSKTQSGDIILLHICKDFYSLCSISFENFFFFPCR